MQTHLLLYLKHKQRMRMLLVFAYSISALSHNQISTITFIKKKKVPHWETYNQNSSEFSKVRLSY